MQKLLRFILSADRKRRALVVGIALWLLRQIRDVEEEDFLYNLDKLDEFDLEHDRHGYIAIEEEYLSCEYALAALDSAIDELEYAY